MWVVAGVVLLLACVAGVRPAPLPAQAIPIEEFKRLIAEREAKIERFEARLSTFETRGAELGAAKREAEPGGSRFEEISNQIRAISAQITSFNRQLRILYEQNRDLRTSLYRRYNEEIPRIGEQIEALTSRPRTQSSSDELQRLTDLLRIYIQDREIMVTQIEVARIDLFLPDLALDPSDGPSELRIKEAIARDAVDAIDGQIVVLRTQIDRARERDRTRRDMTRLRQGLELWGDDRGIQSAGQIEQILEDRASGDARVGGADVFGSDAEERLEAVEARIDDLIARRAEYEAKARQFAQSREEFYR